MQLSRTSCSASNEGSMNEFAPDVVSAADENILIAPHDDHVASVGLKERTPSWRKIRQKAGEHARCVPAIVRRYCLP